MTFSYKFKKIEEFFGLGKPIDAGFNPVKGLPIIFLAGLTGTGASVTATSLTDSRNDILLLPSRMYLTDRITIPWALEKQGKSYTQISNRKVRYEMNKFFRKFFEGGIAEVVEQLSFQSVGNYKAAIFDNFRHVKEVVYAEKAFENCFYILLKSNLLDRVKRIANSNYTFSDIGTSHIYNNIYDIPGWNKALNHKEMEEIKIALENGETEVVGTNQAIQIIIKESEEYDYYKLSMKLFEVAQDRTLLIDSSQMNPQERAEEISEWIDTKIK